MVKETSQKITNKLIEKGIIMQEDKDVYVYSIESTIVIVITYTIFFLLCYIFNEIRNSLVFLITFILLRKSSGGYHAKNYTFCSFLSILSYFTLLIILKIEKFTLLGNIWFSIVGLVIIFCLAPIPDPNKPFTIKQEKVLFFISKLLSISGIVVIFLLKISKYTSFFYKKEFLSISYAIFLVSMSLIIGYLKRRWLYEEYK